MEAVVEAPKARMNTLQLSIRIFLTMTVFTLGLACGEPIDRDALPDAATFSPSNATDDEGLEDDEFEDDEFEDDEEHSELLDAVEIDADDIDPGAIDDGPTFDPESVTTEPPAELGAYEAEEAQVLALLNDERAKKGKPALVLFWDLEDDARRHSATMKKDDHLHHNPELGSATKPEYWTKLGENVGRGGSVQALHDAFMASAGHRANILGDFSHVGIGVTADAQQLWVTVVFMKAAVPGLEKTFPPFVDDDFDFHEENIYKIYQAGITHGCAGGTRPKFCPGQGVTRGQMAALLDKAFNLPATNQSFFTDTQGQHYEAAANRLAAAGITQGCEANKFCGQQQVIRGQLALFLDRALNLPPTNTEYFTDTVGTIYHDAANRLRAAGITQGCGGTKFCPTTIVTRAQIATFLAVALGL
jgi:hypothetical protein